MNSNTTLEGLIWQGGVKPEVLARKAKTGIIFQTVTNGMPDLYAINFNKERTYLQRPRNFLPMGCHKTGIIAYVDTKTNNNSRTSEIISLNIDGTQKSYDENICPPAGGVTVPVIKPFDQGFAAILEQNLLGLYYFDGRIIEVPEPDIGMGKKFAPYDNGLVIYDYERKELKFKTILEITDKTQYPFSTGRVCSQSHFWKKCKEPEMLQSIKGGAIYQLNRTELEYWMSTPSKIGKIPFNNEFWHTVSHGIVLEQGMGKSHRFTCKTLDGDEWTMHIDEQYAWWLAYG